MDETSYNTIPNKVPFILSKKGKKLMYKASPVKRGINIILIYTFNANGSYIPPALITARKKERSKLAAAIPSNFSVCGSKSRFINTNLFIKWLHFQYNIIKSHTMV